MPEIAQIRVHGVGGATPEGLLGLPPGTETVRVAGDEASGFYVRPIDHGEEGSVVEGFVWGKLTSGSLAQALWIFLLPFTLFNVANWMYPRRKQRAGRVEIEGAADAGGNAGPAAPERTHPVDTDPFQAPRDTWRSASRFVMFLLGLALTANYVLWEFELVVRQLLYDRAWSTPTVRFTLGVGATIALGLLVLWIALRTRTDFEHVPTPQALHERLAEPKPARLGFPLIKEERLADPFFWTHAKDSARLLGWHLCVGTAVLATATLWTLPHALRSADPLPEGLNLGPLFLWLGLVVGALFLALLLTYLVACGLHVADDAFRVLPPVVVAGLSFGLASGAFSGLGSVIRARTNSVGTPDFDLGAAFGVGMIAFIVAFLWWLVQHAWLKRRHEKSSMKKHHDPPVDDSVRRGKKRGPEPGAEQKGVSEFFLGKIAFVRALAPGIRNMDWVLTATSFAFLIAAGAILVYDLLHPGPPPGWLAFLASFGAWAVKTVIAAAIPFLVYRAFKPSARAKIAIIWDILTFFPRRYHPFAVRPYAERAVPELEGRLNRHVYQKGRRVALCVHSQGCVLAFAALEQLSAWNPDLTRQIALITFGCPLAQLHARFFPQCFGRDLFEALPSKLFSPEGHPEIAWKNFYRLTDYIGQTVFPEGSPFSGIDEKMPDPPQEPPRGDLPWKPLRVPPDPPQPIWTRLMVHSYYNNAPPLRRWVDDTVYDALRP